MTESKTTHKCFNCGTENRHDTCMKCGLWESKKDEYKKVSSPQMTSHVAEIADALDKLTLPMKNVLLAGNAEEHEAGIGTWMKLKTLGLVDHDFNITPPWL